MNFRHVWSKAQAAYGQLTENDVLRVVLKTFVAVFAFVVAWSVLAHFAVLLLGAVLALIAACYVWLSENNRRAG